MRAVLDRIWLGFAFLGAAGYIVAIIATLIDVVGRFAGVPLIYGTIDVVVVCMVLAGAFAAPVAEWHDTHIKVDPLTVWIPARLRPRVDAFWRGVSGILLGLICWRALQEAMLAHGYGQVMPSIGISLGVLGALVFAGFGLGMVAALTSLLLPPEGARSPH